MKLVRLALATLLSVGIAGSFEPARAGWSNDPGANFRFAPSPGDQWIFQSAEDGAGGAFIAWSESNDVRAQHVTAAGLVAPGWPANGITICGASGAQYPTSIAPDGAGGFVVGWDDYRSGSSADVYVQRVAANGASLWTLNGVAACAASGNQYNTRVCTDRAGGAIVTWWDDRAVGAQGTDTYAQRVSVAGAPLWAANGVAVATLTGDQCVSAILSDGTVGGAYITWRDTRAGDADIYAMRLDSYGSARSGWVANGNPVAVLAGDVTYPELASDGAYGVFVAWSDARSGSYDVYLSRLTPQGAVASGWPASGMAVTSDVFQQFEAKVVPDGVGGAVVGWADLRNGNYDVFAQRVGSAGAIAWSAGGVPLTVATGDQYSLRLVPDGQGGAVAGWHDTRTGTPAMVFAQRVTGAGSIAMGFAADGNAIATAHWVQDLAMCSDGAGGAILVWQHNAVPQQGHVQRIDRWGYLGAQPRIASVRDVPGDQGGRVKLSWDPSPLDAYPDNAIATYMIYRSVPPQAALAALAGGDAVLEGDAQGGAASARAEREAAAPARRTLVATQLSGVTYYWEYLSDVAAMQLPGYSYLAATTQDSVAGTSPRTLFMVRAQDWSYGRYWYSDPDSGYSTDDLAPAAPAPFTGNYFAGATNLHWGANAEADLASYRLYRGATAGFVPSPGNLVAALPDTGYVDGGPAGYYYKLTAVDSHGNESAASLLTPSGTLAVLDAPQWELALAPAMPNPSAGAMTCRFTLPAAGAVRVAVHDAAGRLVRVLADGPMAAGEHALRWDGGREDGGRVPSGLYLARLSFAGRTLTQKLLRVR